MASLAVPLSNEMVEAANRLHAELIQWAAIDRTLDALHTAVPGFRIDDTLTKVVALTRLYGSGVQARHLRDVGTHTSQLLSHSTSVSLDSELVERLAHVPVSDGAKANHVYYCVFASKFAHFFVNPLLFPICDDIAERMVEYHLGSQNYQGNPARRYEAFVINIDTLRAATGLTCSHRELDRYLWLAGEYRFRYLRNPNDCNAEVRWLVQSCPQASRADLRLVLDQFAGGIP